MEAGCAFDAMEYVDENSIDPNLICSICHKPLKDPVCTPCDHTYGRVCIIHWLIESINYSCPVCKKQSLLIKDLTVASRPLRNMLDQLRVRCILCERTDLQRGNFDDHIKKNCSKAIIECQAADIKCPWKGQRDELENHASTCVFEPLRPVLAGLIAENQKLSGQVQKHGNEIRKLTEKISQMNSRAANGSNDESDGSSVSETIGCGKNQKQEDAIFIRNLPATIKFNDLFDVFSKIGQIRYNRRTQQAEVFIFRNPKRTNGTCTAKIVYVDKESAAAAVAEYNNKHNSQWNTRLLISISDAKRTNVPELGKGNNEGNIGSRMTGDEEKGSNKDQTNPNVNDQPQSATGHMWAGTSKKTHRQRDNSQRGNKPTN